MINRDELISYIHQDAIGSEIIATAQKVDTNANGIQLHGAEDVEKIVVGTTMSMDFLEEAVASEAQFCIAHHGLGLNDRYIYNSKLNPALENQLKYAIAHDLTLAAYHFALDHHPVIGNNAQIIQKLGAGRLDTPYFDEWGWVAEFEKEQKVQDVAKKCSEIFDHDVFAVYGGPEKIRRIGVVSGGGKPSGSWLFEIFEKNIDLHITGEIAESGPSLAKDGHFNYFACGHYATETLGVQALGNTIKDHFKEEVSVEFIDISNPL